MGEMADYYIEQIYDHDVFWETPAQNLMCKYCHKWNFHWAQTPEKKWRLHTISGKIHKCTSHPSLAKD
jgi:hypothetical protein